MKKNLSFTILYFISALVLFSCRREIAAEQENRQTDFTSAAAKEWYYATFKKSAEWQESSQKGKKLPEWNHPNVSKLGSTEFVEYPLKKAHSAYPITATDFSGKSLNVQETVRTAEASTSKIVFFKQPSGKIIVREFDYIPDWNYLNAKKFDIGNTSILGQQADFTGRVIVKNWKGDIINMAYYENGIAKMRGRKAGKSANLNPGTPIDNENCHEAEFCIWQQDCDLSIYGDGMVTYECTNWYNTGECWMEYWCDEGGDPCEVAGIGCHDEGRDSGDEPPSPPEIVNNVDDPCIRNSVISVVNGGCKNQITNFINTTFANSDQFHLQFNDAVLAGSSANVDAHTSCGPMADLTQMLTIITFNNSQLGNSSQEYLAATVLHEAVHAWIDHKFPDPIENAAQHQLMASTSRFALMREALMEMFPNLPLQDASDLTWGGLFETVLFNSLSNAEKSRIIEKNHAFKNGNSGTPCVH